MSEALGMLAAAGALPAPPGPSRPRRRIWYRSAAGAVCAAMTLTAGCSAAGDGTRLAAGADGGASESPRPIAAESTSGLDGLDGIALPGEDGAAVAPLSSATADEPAIATAEPGRVGAAGVATTAPAAAAPATTAAGPTTSGAAPSTTSTIPGPVGGTTALPPAQAATVYGPLALVNSGESASTFNWQQISSSAAGVVTTSVSWVVDGAGERVDVSDAQSDDQIVRVNGEYWMRTAEGDSQRVSEAEYLNVRRQWLAEPFASGVAEVLAVLAATGPDRYEVASSDQALIGRVLGEPAPAGSTLEGNVVLDEAGRIVSWDLFIARADVGGVVGDTSTAILGQLSPGTDGPITAP